jgi:hypothetical protein
MLAALGLLWVAAFSLIFTAGSSIGLWSWASSVSASPFARYADLPMGLGFAVALGATLLRRPRLRLPGPPANP